MSVLLDPLKIAIAVPGPPPHVKNLPCRIFISFDRFQTNPTDLASAVLLGLVAAATWLGSGDDPGLDQHVRERQFFAVSLVSAMLAHGASQHLI